VTRANDHRFCSLFDEKRKKNHNTAGKKQQQQMIGEE